MTRPLLLALLATALLAACSDAPSASPRPTTAAPGPTAPAATGHGGTAAPSVPAGTDPGTTGVPSATTPAAATSRTGAPQVLPAFRADSRTDTAEPSGGPLTVVAVRAARQTGYDRVVLELRGTQPGAPGWRVGYVDAPAQDGSGRPVQVAGSAFLEVVVTGVGYPFDTGQTEATQDLTPTDTRVVREVDLQATFEGQFQAFVGLAARRPFRVFRLSNPARVVLDVRHG